MHIDLAVKVLWFVYWEANSHPGCMNGLRKRYSHLVGLISGREDCFCSERALSSVRIPTNACLLISLVWLKGTRAQ